MAGGISILDGSTFFVSDENGDIAAGQNVPQGFFFKDTRHLSIWKLTVNGVQPDPLSTDSVEYYFAQFFCSPPTGTIYTNPTLSVVRRRLVGDGCVERISVINHSSEAQVVELEMQVGADFADLFEVKDALTKKGEYYCHVRQQELVLGYRRENFSRETVIAANVPPADLTEGRFAFRPTVPAKESWELEFQIKPVVAGIELVPKFAEKGKGAALREDFANWIHNAPTIISQPPIIRQVYMRSLMDIAALRFRPNPDSRDSVPAAGLPWFMALFGRDSLITSYQLLPFEPRLAATTLRVLAASQGKVEDDFRDEEPGKILHELRFGELTHFLERPQSPYYGTADATPLFLVLLDEYELWTGDTELVRSLEPNARAALEWIDRFGDRDGDGYIEYQRKTDLGLENQCWKDSWNSVLFSNGAVASSPRALCEIQGYAYDAKVRCARLARHVWNDPDLAVRLEREAHELKRRFNHDFFIPEREFFAEALDGDKKKVDSLTSNIGHLLWSGIVDSDKAEALKRHLMGPQLFSGWGVRTMATCEAGYNPIEYHNGTVWPHDNSLIAAGLARYGFREEAGRIVTGILEAALFFQYRLPEVFAGYDRKETAFPVRYPTASSPQAWAAGAPLLGIRVLLGMEPRGEVLQTDPALPPYVGTLALEGIPGRWGKANVVAEQKGAPSYKQLYTRFLAERSHLGVLGVAEKAA